MKPISGQPKRRWSTETVQLYLFKSDRAASLLYKEANAAVPEVLTTLSNAVQTLTPSYRSTDL